MSKVSIVLSTYNGEKYLEEQIESIMSGTFRDITIEVSDDCSMDSTISLVKKLMKKYPEQITLHQNEKNLGYTMNFLGAIKRSEGKYIMLCDQDDIWLPDKVEKTLACMQKAEKQSMDKPVLVYTDAWLYDGEQDKTMGLFHENSHLNTEKVDISHLLIENKCIGCTVMINYAVKEYLSELPEHIRVHDWWLALICASFGKVAYLNEPTLNYRQHGGNMIGGTSFQDYFVGRIRTLKEQKKTIESCYNQAEAFYHLFEEKLDDKEKQVVKKFYTMKEAGWFDKRLRCFKYGFWKSGASRNIGLLLIL